MKTSTKIEQEIVVKRTYIENVYENDKESPEFIIIRFLVYVPGQENLIFGYHEEDWVYYAINQEWQNRDPESRSVLCKFLGVENDVCIQTILNLLKDAEFVTTRYTTTVEIKEGHSLPTCGSCKYWSEGYCEFMKQNIPEDHIIPCSREFFEPKAPNNV